LESKYPKLQPWDKHPHDDLEALDLTEFQLAEVAPNNKLKLLLKSDAYADKNQ